MDSPSRIGGMMSIFDFFTFPEKKTLCTAVNCMHLQGTARKVGQVML